MFAGQVRFITLSQEDREVRKMLLFIVTSLLALQSKTPSPRVGKLALHESFSVRLECAKKSVRVGERLPLRILLENSGDATEWIMPFGYAKLSFRPLRPHDRGEFEQAAGDYYIKRGLDMVNIPPGFFLGYDRDDARISAPGDYELQLVFSPQAVQDLPRGRAGLSISGLFKSNRLRIHVLR